MDKIVQHDNGEGKSFSHHVAPCICYEGDGAVSVVLCHLLMLSSIIVEVELNLDGKNTLSCIFLLIILIASPDL